MQHFKVKIFAAPGGAEIERAVPVFHRWIQDGALPELLIDVADYQHVPNGPGVILVAHEGIYSLDRFHGKLGLTYTRRTVLGGDDEARLRQAVEAAGRAAALLEAAPEFEGKLKFDRGRWEVSVNDRAEAPNTQETYLALKPVIEAVFPAQPLEHVGEPRELLRVAVG